MGLLESLPAQVACHNQEHAHGRTRYLFDALNALSPSAASQYAGSVLTSGQHVGL